MQFNPEPNKQTNKVICSPKSNSNSFPYPPVKFNENNITKRPHHKLLGIVLDSNLNFILIKKNKKCNKPKGLINRLSVNLTRNALLTIYKSFIRSHRKYGDILYDQPDNENVQNKIEKLQYKGCLAITVAIRRTSRERLYEELGLITFICRKTRAQ